MCKKFVHFSSYILSFPTWETNACARARARVCVRACVHACLCVGPSYFTDSSLFNFRLYGNTYKMRGCVSYTAASFLKYRVLPPLHTAPCGSITPLNTLLYIAHPPTLNRWNIPKAFHFLSSYTRDRSIIKYMSAVTHLHR